MSRWGRCVVWLAFLPACAGVEEEVAPGCIEDDCALRCLGAGFAHGTCAPGFCTCAAGRPPGADADADAAADAADSGSDDAGRDDGRDDDADAGTDRPDADARETSDDAGSEDAAAPLACGDFFDCLSACYDDACMDGCYARICPAAEIALMDLSLCIEDSCGTLCYDSVDEAACNDCINLECTTAIDACMRSTCG